MPDLMQPSASMMTPSVSSAPNTAPKPITKTCDSNYIETLSIWQLHSMFYLNVFHKDTRASREP